jgi:hypothetical protein
MSFSRTEASQDIGDLDRLQKHLRHHVHVVKSLVHLELTKASENTRVFRLEGAILDCSFADGSPMLDIHKPGTRPLDGHSSNLLFGRRNCHLNGPLTGRI